MAANTIERRDAGETARRLSEAATRHTGPANTSRADQKCVDPRDERAVAAHAMEQWIEGAANRPTFPSTATMHSGMPYAIAPAPALLPYLATHASSHDGEGAEAIMHGATMVHPH